jgi:hypothetical protein
MTALIDRFTVGTFSRHITDIIAAYLVATIAFGGSINGAAEWVAVAQVVLAIKLHVFAIPLAFTPAFGLIPPWGWYVVVVMWLANAVHRSGYTTAEMVEQFEDAYRSWRTDDGASEVSEMETAEGVYTEDGFVPEDELQPTVDSGGTDDD